MKLKMNSGFIKIISAVTITLMFSFAFANADEAKYSSLSNIGKQEDADADDGYKSYTDIGRIDDTNITVKNVVAAPNEFHRDVFTVEGVASEVEYKSLPNGRKFTLFYLTDAEDNDIKVYARGYIDELEDGSELRLHGRYSKEKRFVFKTYKHVMKARKIQFIPSHRSAAY